MYDARNTGVKSAGGLGFGLVVVAVVGALFLGILMFPSLTGEGKRAVPGLAETVNDDTNMLFVTFEDEPTRAYIRKLRATFPAAAAELETKVRRARARGADDVELGLLVMQAGTEQMSGNMDRLAKADVRYFNAMLSLSSDALGELSRSGAPYCKGTDLMAFASLSEQQLYAAAFDRVGHGAGLYEFGLEFNGLVLDAIRDARANPVNYGPMTTGDEQALQTLAFSMMANPEIMKLMTLEGKSRTEMDRAMASVNFCDLGSKMIGQVKALPDATKGRLWGEMMRQVASGQAQRALGRLAY